MINSRLLSSPVLDRKLAASQVESWTYLSSDHTSRGIGLESSLLFAAEGANVLLVDINLAGAEKGAALIKERFPNVKALAVKADVGKEADIRSAVDMAVKEFGRLDVMVRRSKQADDRTHSVRIPVQ